MKTLYYLTLITAASSIVKSDYCDDKEDGMYCNPSDANSFYRCYNTKTFKFKCPNNLVFNTKTKNCGWIGNCKQYTTDIKPNVAVSTNDKVKQFGDLKHLFTFNEKQEPNVNINKPISIVKPQIVMLTFDDAVTSEAYGFYKKLFTKSRRNPDGCKIKSTFFVSGGTDFSLVNKIYKAGHEIAVHTLSHRYPRRWWGQASYEEYRHEIMGMKERLSSEGGVPRSHLTGFRVPFLQLGGDTMYNVLEDGGFTHDSSMYPELTLEPRMPFRMTTPDRKMCIIHPCPKQPHPTIWQFPMLPWFGPNGEDCSMADEKQCNSGDTLTYLKNNFARFYTSNRVPFPIYIHYYWLRDPTNLLALGKFIDELLLKNDVWFATQQQVLKWVKTLNSGQKFPPWQCLGEQTLLE